MDYSVNIEEKKLLLQNNRLMKLCFCLLLGWSLQVANILKECKTVLSGKNRMRPQKRGLHNFRLHQHLIQIKTQMILSTTVCELKEIFDFFFQRCSIHFTLTVRRISQISQLIHVCYFGNIYSVFGGNIILGF